MLFKIIVLIKQIIIINSVDLDSDDGLSIGLAIDTFSNRVLVSEKMSVVPCLLNWHCHMHIA